jgi:3-isopropylmalate/(R)-2-methylmalate dehydratase small subunit
VLGLGAVIAKSFGRIYFRNALNNGLLLAECEDIYDAVEHGEEITMDTDKGEIITAKGTFKFPPIPDEVLNIVDAGGLVPYVQRKLGIA